MPYCIGHMNTPLLNSLDSVRNDPPLLLRESETAVMLGVSIRTVRNYDKRGLLKPIRIGGRKLYRRETLLATLQKLEDQQSAARKHRKRHVR